MSKAPAGGTQASLYLALAGNDGDKVVAVAPFSSKILVLKQRSTVLLIPDNSGGYSREIISASAGCASPDSVVSFEDMVVWADYNGIYGYSNTGIQLLNQAWKEDYRSMSSATKEASVAVFDRANRRYRILLGAFEFQMSVDDLEWMLMEWGDLPEMYDSGTLDSVRWLSNNQIFVESDASLQNGASFNLSYYLNLIKVSKGDGFDILPDGMMIDFVADCPVYVDIIRDSVASINVTSIQGGDIRGVVRFPLGALCKAIGVSVRSTVLTAGQSFRLNRVGYYFDEVPQGGDALMLSSTSVITPVPPVISALAAEQGELTGVGTAEAVSAYARSTADQ